jgi:hypothetical protein
MGKLLRKSSAEKKGVSEYNLPLFEKDEGQGTETPRLAPSREDAKKTINNSVFKNGTFLKLFWFLK